MNGIVPATAELLDRFYAERPDVRPKMTTKSLVALKGGRPVGVTGFYVEPEKGRVVMFANLTEELRSDKRMIVRGYRAVLNVARGFGMRIYALADPAIDGSATLLAHMGGVDVGDRVYEFDPKGGF